MTGVTEEAKDSLARGFNGWDLLMLAMGVTLGAVLGHAIGYENGREHDQRRVDDWEERGEELEKQRDAALERAHAAELESITLRLAISEQDRTIGNLLSVEPECEP